MTKESKYSNEPNRCIFRFTGNSEQECRKQGGVPAGVTFNNGTCTISNTASRNRVVYPLSVAMKSFLTDGGTFRMKMKFNTLDQERFIAFEFGGNTFQFSLTTGNFINHSHYSGTFYISNKKGDTAVVIDTWYNITVTHLGTVGSGILYINADVEATAGSGLGAGFPDALSIGSTAVVDFTNDITVDLIEIYNYILTAEEVSNLYEGKRFRALVSSDEILSISSNLGSIVGERNNSLDNNAVTIVKEGEIRAIKLDGSTSYIGTELAALNDWFLPSRDLLIELITNLYGVGEFPGTSNWWSSSEIDATKAYKIACNSGSPTSSSTTKSLTQRTRACRSFAAAVGAYSLRDTGPAGGLIGYISGTTFYEVSPSDQSVAHIWSNIDDTEIGAGAQGTAIGTGQANTTAIIGQAGHTDSAAKLCDDLSFLNPNYIIGVLAPTTEGSFASWIRTKDNSVTQEIISFGDTDADTRLQWDLTGTGLLRGLAGIGGVTKWAVETSNAVIKNGVWTHVALVQDGTEPVLYVDGIAVAQTFSTSTDKTFWFSQMSGLDNERIGCGNWNGGGNATFFSGMLNEIKVFKTDLTAQNVSQLFSESRQRYIV